MRALPCITMVVVVMVVMVIIIVTIIGIITGIIGSSSAIIGAHHRNHIAIGPSTVSQQQDRRIVASANAR